MNLLDALDFWMGLPPIRQRMKGKADIKSDENHGVSALWRTSLYFRTAISRERRQEEPSSSLVRYKRFTEIGRQEGFFFARLSIKIEQNGGEREYTAILACCECRSNYGDRHTGINRMADVRVGACADDLMSLLDGNCRAPIFS
jgi:hypothetical protein